MDKETKIKKILDFAERIYLALLSSGVNEVVFAACIVLANEVVQGEEEFINDNLKAEN